MKARATTLLSVMGVLVAGSAAAMVNAQVLQPSASSTATPTVVGSAAPADTASASVPLSVAPAPATQAIYQIATSGAITLDTSGGVLTVVGVVPYGEWALVGVTSSATQADVVLQSGTTLVEFSASLVGGIVSTGVRVSQVVPESDDEGHTGTTAAHQSASTTTSVHHDDDDDEDEDEEEDGDDD